MRRTGASVNPGSGEQTRFQNELKLLTLHAMNTPVKIYHY
jgi:hypothetical protein